MSVRKNQNQVDELRAQIEACAVVARQQAQAIDEPVKAHEYFDSTLYKQWLNDCRAFYIWLKEQDVPKNVQCDTVDQLPGMRSEEYIDCSDDGYRMIKNITTADHSEHADYDVHEWTHIEKSIKKRKDRLLILQDMENADKIFCKDCDTCAFTPNITQDFITAYFFKAAPIVTTKRGRDSDQGKSSELVPQEKLTTREIIDDYTNWLVDSAEYVYIPNTGRGFIFCNIIDSQDTASHHGLQWNGSSYLYVELLCAKEGTSGKILLAEALKLAAFKGLSHIVLSSLGHVIFYYLDVCGFQLAKRDFTIVPVPLDSRWRRKKYTPYLIPISEDYKEKWGKQYDAMPGDKTIKKMYLKLAGIAQNFMQSA